MKYKTRKYPLFSACGLNCGLCPRYYTVGSSKCTGCAGEGFSEVHPSCGKLSCSQRKGNEHCFLCEDFPCTKYDGAGFSDSFITYQKQMADVEKAKRIGMDAYEAELNAKVKLLEELLKNYDDGRRKSFFCTSVNILDLQDVKTVTEHISDEVAPTFTLKEKAKTAARLFEEMAEQRGVSLKLRK